MVTFRTRARYMESILAGLKEETTLTGGESLVEVTAAFPPQPEPDASPHWPPEIARQFKDAQNFIHDRVTPSIILGVCRTILDVVTRKLGADERASLKVRIDKLSEKGVITRPLAEWAHDLRLDGNSALHEASGEEADAREYVEFLRMLLNMTFTLPARMAEKKSAPAD